MFIQSADFDLEKPPQNGLYSITQQTLPFLVACAHHWKLQVHQLDVSSCYNKSTLLFSLRHQLHMHNTLVHNWDGLLDVLRHLGSWKGRAASHNYKGDALFFSGLHVLSQKAPAETSMLEEILATALKSSADLQRAFVIFSVG